MVNYEIIHVWPDNSHHPVATVSDKEHLELIIETPRYVGTWLNANRKLLRFGRGELIIKELTLEPRVISHKIIPLSTGRLVYELCVKDDELLKAIILDNEHISGLTSAFDENITDNILWSTDSFTKLSDLTTKEIAYQTFRYYEKFCMETGLESAI